MHTPNSPSTLLTRSNAQLQYIIRQSHPSTRRGHRARFPDRVALTCKRLMPASSVVYLSTPLHRFCFQRYVIAARCACHEYIQTWLILITQSILPSSDCSFLTPAAIVIGHRLIWNEHNLAMCTLVYTLGQWNYCIATYFSPFLQLRSETGSEQTHHQMPFVVLIFGYLSSKLWVFPWAHRCLHS